ncbi:hypothetical protein ABIC33_004211 [Variovorax sp. 1140]|uniref:hypothetical protein n=1 Tax=Variovorax atrisoli TaxID=3394203 RepID=UPI003391D882
MNELSAILQQATAAIEPCYFQLNIDGGDPVFRERVYCYELYHQMRSRWPEQSEFKLNGEIDKQAHPVLMKLGAAGAKPDLLVHTPGHMNGNHAILEVKHSTAAAGIRKDLRTLDLFAAKVGYRRAIYLIYGWESATQAVPKVLKVARHANIGTAIEIWCHSDVGEAAMHVASLLPSADGIAAFKLT